MRQHRDARPYRADTVEINIDKGEAGRFVHVQQYLPPRVDDEAMPIGLAPILMGADLRRGDDERRRFDRAGTRQYLPVRLPRGTRQTPGRS